MLFTLFSFSCFASSEPKYDAIKLKEMPKSLASEVINALSELHYKPVFTTLKGSELLRVNLMFSDSFLSSKIIIKYNTRGDYQLAEQYQLKKGIVYHLKLDDKESAIYFENLKPKEISEIITKIKNRKKLVKSFSLFPKAHADCSATLSGTPTIEIDSGVAAAGGGSILSNCMSGLGDGIEESTVGVLGSIWNGVSSEASRLWNNPGERLGEYWGFVSDGAQALWDFMQVLGRMFVDPVYAGAVLTEKFGEIGQFFVNAYESVAGMPANEQAQLFCNILGSIGVDVLIAAISVGAASGKLGVTITRLLLKLKKIAAIIGKGIKVPFRILEKVSDNLLKRLRTFDSIEDKAFINRKLRGLGCAI